jgi:hypothetical protein
VGISPGMDLYRLSYEISPIILTNGIAENIPGGGLPIIAITEALNFVDGLLSGPDDLNFDDFFAHFIPLPGSTLGEQQLGEYPFANQAVAANSVIRQPLTISMRMICPARGESGYALKLATMSALKTTLDLHNASGGTYTIATPSWFYTNCVFLKMFDTSMNESKQVQNTYQLDFRRPLITLEDAQAAQNSLMAQITAGTPINGIPSWSGLSPTLNNPPSLATIGTLSPASGTAGVSTATPSFGGQ